MRGILEGERWPKLWSEKDWESPWIVGLESDLRLYQGWLQSKDEDTDVDLEVIAGLI